MLNRFHQQTGAIEVLFFKTAVRPIDSEVVSDVLAAQQLLVYCMCSPPGVKAPPLTTALPLLQQQHDLHSAYGTQYWYANSHLYATQSDWDPL